MTTNDERTRAPAPTRGDPGFEVRPATPWDAASFHRMFRAVVAEGRFLRSETPHGSVRHYRRVFRSPWTQDQASLVAIDASDGTTVIGHLNISREEHPATRHVASLGMAVAAEWRRRGVGSALLREALRWAREVGVEKLALSVYPDNVAARRLYERFGFREEGRLSGHSKKSDGYRDELVMGLWLIPQPEGSSS
jgi:L-phenylalanine/L-methionine N-acetyltransferase